MSKYGIGLSLSGGGVLGAAHIGALRALEEKNLHPDIIAGTSIGSVVGALYAAGNSLDEITRFFKTIKIWSLFKWKVPKAGLLDLNVWIKYFEQFHLKDDFDSLNLPLYVTITNLNTARPEYIHSGSLYKYLIASCSIPLLFKPTEINQQIYVDGGVTDNLPITPIRHLCDKLIAIDLRPLELLEPKMLNSSKSISHRIVMMSINRNVRDELPKADIPVVMHGIDSFSMFNLSHVDALIEFGYERTKYAIDENNV